MFLLLLFYLVTPAAQAQGSLPENSVALSLEEAVKFALDQSLSIKRNAIDLGGAEYAAQRLWSEVFPGFSVRAGVTLLPATPLFSDSPSFNSDAQSYSLNLGVSLSLNTALKASMDRIALAYQTQILNYNDAYRLLEIRVVKEYLRLAALQRSIAHREASLMFAMQTMENTRVAWQFGHSSELTWLNSQFSVESARYDLITAQVSYQNALGEFLALLGLDANTVVILDGSIEITPVVYDPDKLIFEYLPKRPDIIRQHQTVRRLELGSSITSLTARTPSLELSTQWSGGTQSNGNQGFSSPFVDRISGSINLNIPIDSWIPGTRQEQNVRSARAEVEKAKLDLENALIQGRTEIRSLVANLRTTWASIEIARLRVDLAQRTLDAAGVAFRNGTASFQELEDRRKDLVDVQQRLLEIELSYQNLLLDIASALNVDWRTVTMLPPIGAELEIE